MQFTRRAIRDACGWGTTQLKGYFKRLCDEELLAPVRSSATESWAYTLHYTHDADDQRVVLNLLDVSLLQEIDENNNYDAEWSGFSAQRSACGRVAVGMQSACGRGGKNEENPVNHAAILHIADLPTEIRIKGDDYEPHEKTSYIQGVF